MCMYVDYPKLFTAVSNSTLWLPPPSPPPDLISMIYRLASDTLEEQRTSPSPQATPEASQTSPDHYNYPEQKTPPDVGQRERRRDRERKERDGKQRKSHPSKHSSSNSSSTSKGGSHESLSERKRSTHEKKRLTTSKSTDLLDSGSHRPGEGSQSVSTRSTVLNPHATRSSTSTAFARTKSGVAISSTQKVQLAPQRAFSPPANMSHAQRTISPPPPATKPPPLPVKTQRKLESANQRWSGSSLPSTTDSEGSMTTELHSSHPRYAGDYAGPTRGTREGRSFSMGQVDNPRYFPGAFPTTDRSAAVVAPSQSNPVYANSSAIHEHHRSASHSYQRQHQHRNPQHPLDNFVSEAYSNAPSMGTGGHHRQRSWPARVADPSHPLQTNVQSSTNAGATLSSYPWHQAHPHRRYSSQVTRTAQQRRNLTENAQLMQAGDKIVQQEIEDYRRSSSDTSSNTSSEQYRAPLSPTTHMLVVPEDDNSTNQQHETFV